MSAVASRQASIPLAAVLLAACGPDPIATTCKDPLLPGDLVITEVFADFKATTGGAGTDTGKEWFEIYNAADRPVELAGVTITHSRLDGSNANTHVMGALIVAPGQFLTLGNTTRELLPAYIDYGYGADLGDLFNADGGKLALSCGASEIDHTTYDSIKEGHSRELTASQPPDYTLNDDVASWCQGNDSEFESGNFGTPGSDNDCVPVVAGQCDDHGTLRDSIAPVAGDLVITEVMPNPAKVSDTVGEWFEAKVMHDVDLNGVGLDRAGDSSAPNVITSPDCIHVTTGEYVTFARSTEGASNGGLPAGAVAGTFSFALIDGTAAAPGDVRIVAGSTIVDAVSWTKSTSGTAHQLDPDLVDASANDNESNFCDATTTYGLGDLGTPDAANAQCTLLPPPGKCEDNGLLRAIVKPSAGQLVISELLANPATGTTGSDSTREWFEITNTGTTAFDLNGLGVGRTGMPANVVQSAKCISIAPAGFGLFARSTDPAVNGMLPPVDATFSFSLVDANGNVEVRDGTTVLDVVAWTTGIASGVSKELKRAQTTAIGNDAYPGNFCAGTTPYGDQTNKGSPKAANTTCP